MALFFRIIFIFWSGFFLACGPSFAQKVDAGAGAPADIEVYMAGKKFASIGQYEKKKEQAAAASAAAFDPQFGKTLTISPDGTVITSHTTIDVGKTITIEPQKGTGRVAGVEPSFSQVSKDFDSGAAKNGASLTPVASAAEFEEKLRDKLRGHQGPVLLISDKTRVRVMELEGGEKSP